MKTTKTLLLFAGASSLLCLATWNSSKVSAQVPWGYPPPPVMGGTTPANAQRNALTALQTQVRSFGNTTRVAQGYVNDGVGMVWQHFQAVRMNYNDLKGTLNPQQLSVGANDLADLDAGLDIIQEAFGEYQQDVASGQSSTLALRDMCRVLDRAIGVWMQQLNRVAARLRVGWV